MTLFEDVVSLHSDVKEHPYRLPENATNTKLKSEYCTLLYKLVDKTYDYVLEEFGRGSQQQVCVHLMYHDFMAADGQLRYYGMSVVDAKYLRLIEKGIGAIHELILTNNISTVFSSCHKYEWNSETGSYTSTRIK